MRNIPPRGVLQIRWFLPLDPLLNPVGFFFLPLDLFPLLVTDYPGLKGAV